MPPIKKTRKSNQSKSKRLSKAQNERIRELVSKSPSVEKLSPEVYSKLQSSVKDAVEKTMPKYKDWLNSKVGTTVVASDCPREICSSCGNDCPREICSSCGNDCPREICSSCGNDCPREICGRCDDSKIGIADRVSNEVINAAMTAAIRSALTEATAQQRGKVVSEAKMRAVMKKELMKAAREIGKIK